MSGLPSEQAAAWAARITACWRESFGAILEAGNLLRAAKAALPHGDFGAMIEGALPFSASTAQRLMAIAADPKITNAAHVQHLPPHWGTLYELTKLDEDGFKAKIADGTIRPDLERTEARAAVQAARSAPERAAYEGRIREGCKVADLQTLISQGKRFGAILADPPWGFDTYSDKGQDRSPEYDTKTIDGIKRLPVERLAADNCALFLWCVMPSLPRAFEVITAWGFTYSTCGFVWVKRNRKSPGLFTGLGYWTRANAELCLLATRGDPERRNRDVQQIIEAPVSEHSRKPEEAHERVERLIDGPYLELYARREHEGWTTWGNEIPRDKFLPEHDPKTGEILEAAE